ncbi:hypothetical protein [Clostridium beijerinckii]|nr:hypothetical protein [Clostridium beijerinckii]NOW05995.1 dTDP-4-amino-4,6-dideoxygalactose transaminase [Clostridium beijerinckii]NYC00861.1 dTDP-4-amino-4,6-dideoxygalactose transaminase [Clostridium beijerinckii]
MIVAYIKEFEGKVAKYVGIKYAVAFLKWNCSVTFCLLGNS